MQIYKFEIESRDNEFYSVSEIKERDKKILNFLKNTMKKLFIPDEKFHPLKKEFESIINDLEN